MKKTLIAIASLSTLIAANATPVSTSSSEVIEGGNAILIDKSTRVKIYPEISVANSLRGTGINVVEQSHSSMETNGVTEQSQDTNIVVEAPAAEVVSEPVLTTEPEIRIVKRTGEITTEPAESGHTSTKKEKVYTKSFLGIPYSPAHVVVESAKPLHFGKLHFHNLTCSNNFNNGSLDVYGNHSSSVIPVVFCPNGTTAQIEVHMFSDPEDRNHVGVEIGGQKLKVEKGYTSLYNLRYDEDNVINLEFIYEVDENAGRL